MIHRKIRETVKDRLEAARLRLLQARNVDGNPEAFNDLCDVVNELRLVIELLVSEGAKKAVLSKPGYWMNETSGILRPAVERYLLGGELSAEDIAALRAYLRQWISNGDFCGRAVQGLRDTVDSLTCRENIALWTGAALDAGIDPW